MIAKETALRGLILQIDGSSGLGWGLAVPGLHDLYPEERAAMSRARTARWAEFAGGREAARRAMAALGLPSAPVPMMPDRAPLWPDGLVGSISHAGGLCLAVVARSRCFASLGVDMEVDTPLDPDLMPEICRPEELASVPSADRPAHAKRLFSAKEAAFKAHYPLARQVFGFHGLSVDPASGRARFTDHPDIAAIPPESRRDLALCQACGDGWVLSFCAIIAGTTGK